ncbi:hypothetical protein SRHO_G00108460 [Serrasalmus rhombeus]
MSSLRDAGGALRVTRIRNMANCCPAQPATSPKSVNTPMDQGPTPHSTACTGPVRLGCFLKQSSLPLTLPSLSAWRQHGARELQPPPWPAKR